MSPKNYDVDGLNSILDFFSQKKSSGLLSLKTNVDTLLHQRHALIVLREGNLVYGEDHSSEAPSNQKIGKMLGEKLNPDSVNAAMSVAVQRLSQADSVRELVDILVKLKVFSWEQVETFMTTKITLILEKFLSHPGEYGWHETDSFDLAYGEDQHSLNWSYIQYSLKQRQQKWLSYKAHIPHMNAIPTVSQEQLKLVDNPQVKNHFSKYIDCKANLIDIADKLGKDPLKVAKNYFGWANKGWINVVEIPVAYQEGKVRNADKPATPSESSVTEDSELPIVLSVDDSPIIQVSIKRALKDQYNVLLADKATAALQILNQKPVKLLLLDLTMPDVDGLQFCRTVRQIPKFKDLPIIMVTARDGLLNKAKGHIAGTSKYLTKPFKPEELREIVGQYISSQQ